MAVGSETRPEQGLFALGQPVPGAMVGQIIATRHPTYAEGDWVLGRTGWREYALVDATGLRRVDPNVGPISASLGVLGMPGFTAWIGIELIARPQPGESIFVSSAAGAVGSLAGQLANARGARTIGSAGSDEKVRWLDSIGFDEAFNYRSGPVADLLAQRAPDGIQVYFDNVGGDHLAAALEAIRDFGRIVICGAISSYNAAAPVPGPDNLELIFLRALTVQGYRNYDYADRFDEFLAQIGPAVRDGRIVDHEHVVDGIENAPAALISMLRGEAFGKTLVHL
jgi:NADPH-dependent curcumin reductase CurA